MEPNTRNPPPTLAQLDQMSGMELRHTFRKSGLGNIPKNASNSFLRGHLAWASQALQVGYDPQILRTELLTQIRHATRPDKPLYKPGTRLIRVWQGVTHEVTIEETGFTWNGQRYRSLSHIAREMTGTRWSGPRFFGLNGKGERNE